MSKRLTQEEFEIRIKNIFGEQFNILSEYKNNHTKVKLKCNKCGNIIYKSPNKMMGKGNEGCYICSGKNWHKTTESFQEEVDVKFPNTYLILGDYVKARQPLLVKRISCGHEYMISPDNLLRGKGCFRCSNKQSSYMDKVEAILEELNIRYEKEKCFSECKDIRMLPFDYYIPQYNTCIEVDGQLHYLPDKRYLNDTDAMFKDRQNKDNIKNNFCRKNNIKLIRLPYYKEDEYKQILTQELYANTEVTT